MMSMGLETREVVILVVGMLHGWGARDENVPQQQFLRLIDAMMERAQPETETWLEVAAAADAEIWFAVRKPV